MRWPLRRRGTKLDVPDGPPIVSDAMVATRGVANGSFVPLVILDTIGRPDVDHVILTHGHFHTGDVDSQWGESAADQHRVVLALDFVRPVTTQLTIEFDARAQGAVIDSVVRTNLLYLQGGKPGDRFSQTSDKAKLLIEVPSESFAPFWEVIYQDAMYASLRAKGLRRSEARQASRLAVKELRSLTGKRMGGITG